MKVYLVRHGQSQWQLSPSQDWDTPLSPLGHQQARHLAAWCAEHELLDAGSRLDVGVLRTSPLKRARETAGYLAESLGLPVQVQPGLTEATFHVVSELPKAPGPLALPQGELSERYVTFRRQVGEALAGLTQVAAENDLPVLAVTHGGVIKTLLRTIAGTDAFCLKLYNCGITAIEWKDGRWRIVHLNLWDHLPPELRTT
ncbi:phosphoglycerate mutase [Streptomyces sulfonofaciens]|uniref:Phosphoglycerate mutase n=1 Tax=Streptomyces sulfonofaciens TaxID=68272 RepID=A0A919G3F2_9ACTN|nr:histidine phosphatase family protein [Streptomyces sulfonofaciens]GHH76979.1 phosphoglycerate mutase [Streptomyces sulfonofaciens]